MFVHGIVGTGNSVDDIHAFVGGERERTPAARRRSIVLLGVAFLASLAESVGLPYCMGRRTAWWTRRTTFLR